MNGVNGGCYSGLETQVLFNKGSTVVGIQYVKREYCSIGVNGSIHIHAENFAYLFYEVPW